MKASSIRAVSGLLLGATFGAAALADCNDVPNHTDLTGALQGVILPTGGVPNGGFELQMWATVVDRDGVVCAVARSGDDRGEQWPGSRVISAQKAYTANAFSLPGLSLATANLWAAVQPGGSLFGLQFSNPVDTQRAYGSPRALGNDTGAVNDYGTADDPMVGTIVGGVNVFGGGLALYSEEGELVGAIGVSGDTSCADHNIAWRIRDAVGLDFVPGGVGTPGDNIVFDVDPVTDKSLGGFGHPTCAGPGDVDGNGDPSDVEDNAEVVAQAPLGD